ncbi:class I SAM-dependent methyltransferase [Psychromonas sp.]|uniref:class I SAM-dependent methyltransferase n=1 Tax=Psychromonas sp. TaxID=1884585 RepID=UPI003564DB07
MIIKKEWRILTVGDGDLSFSNALLSHQPKALTASVYDSLATLSGKYGDHFYRQLAANNTPVFFEFDVTKPASWGALPKHSFDLVIFQFPLLPAFRSFSEYQEQAQEISLNTLNRRLLRTFLINAFNHFLDPDGQQLCFITSKDVKPYREWNIENALHLQTDISYLGSVNFEIADFPGYKIRNVERDKFVRDTRGTTYVWGKTKHHEISPELQSPLYQDNHFCTACRAGPFTREEDRMEHSQSKRHKQMMEFEALWLEDLRHLAEK